MKIFRNINLSREKILTNYLLDKVQKQSIDELKFMKVTLKNIKKL